MEPGLNVPLLYTAASLLSSSSSIVFVFSASLDLCRRRFASPATPTPPSSPEGTPRLAHLTEVALTPRPSPRSPRPPPTPRACYVAADFAFPATPDAAFLTGGHPDARPPRRSSPNAAPLKEEPLAAPDVVRAPRRHRFRFLEPPRPDAAPSSSPEGIPTPTHTSPE
ncbi:predicted GPI-anchored protein 58 [Miscanthus floridulus]|uniref:predicted GPI-anchored protein 58 n=1 Tax=Miscanthus floridulus TaxID=154761 RepID=UPI003457EEB9